MTGFVSLASGLLGFFAIALLVPALVALAAGVGGDAVVFLAVAGLVGFLAGGLAFVIRGRVRRISRLTLFGFVVFAWVVPPLIAAIPIARLSDVGWVPATFEAVSGLTTTGATVYPTLEPLSRALIFWRAELNWIGGLLTLVLIFTILAPSGFAGGGPIIASTSDLRRAATASASIATIYATATGACVLLLLLTGIPPLDALCLALSAVSTGGFMPRDGTLAAYRNGAAEFVLMAFMLIGATSVLWRRAPPGRRGEFFREHRESSLVVAVAIFVGLAYAVSLSRLDVADFPLRHLREGLFSGVSLVTTTGFEPTVAGLAALPVAATLFIAFCGGAAFSAAGGIKYLRIGAMLARSLEELRRLIYPHAVRPARFGRVTTDIPEMKAIWSHLALAIVVFLSAALLLMAAGLAFEGALAAALSAFANIGPLYRAGWAEGAAWPSYGALGAPSQLVLAATMILGRIEVLALFGAAAAIALRRS